MTSNPAPNHGDVARLEAALSLVGLRAGTNNTQATRHHENDDRGEERDDTVAKTNRFDAALGLVDLRTRANGVQATRYSSNENGGRTRIPNGPHNTRGFSIETRQPQSVGNIRSRRTLGSARDLTIREKRSSSPHVRLRHLRPARRTTHAILIGGDPHGSAGQQTEPRLVEKEPFNLWEALCGHEEIMLHLATQHLPPRTFLTMFSISRTFNHGVRENMTSYMVSSARKWGHLRKVEVDGTEPTLPGSYAQADVTTLLPFHHFMHLCIPDPKELHQNSDNLGEVVRYLTAPPTPRDRLFPRLSAVPPPRPSSSLSIRSVKSDRGRFCPSFRYLFFCVHRAKTVLSIIAELRYLEHRLPPRMATTLIKTWYVLDLPTNFLRRSVFNNDTYWTDLDLRLLCLFCIKLDMAFTDPIDGIGEVAMRKMMMAQQSLTVLDEVLRRKQCRDVLGMIRMYIKWKYDPSYANRHYPIFGVAPEEVGSLEKEYWGRGIRDLEEGEILDQPPLSRLMRPDDLVLFEGHRRGLALESNFQYWLTWGYIDPDTMEEYPRDEETAYRKRKQIKDEPDAMDLD